MAMPLPSLFTPLAPAEWDQTDQAMLCARDIQHPWQSVYGFPMAAAQLAAQKKLLLPCREDEVFTLLGRLNDLLKCPKALNHAYLLLLLLEKVTVRNLIHRLEPEQPWLMAGQNTQAAHIDSSPVQSTEKKQSSNLSEILTPSDLAKEIAGLKQMLARLEAWLPALNQVKDQGFHVVVLDRRRQSYRPALEAHRNETILLDHGQPSGLKAGFLQPTRYHLTLWAYLVVRSDTGQSVIWN